MSPHGPMQLGGCDALERDKQYAQQLARPLQVLEAHPKSGGDIVDIVREGDFDAVVLPTPLIAWSPNAADDWTMYVLRHSPCSVFLATHPVVPREIVG
jgi:hypothetical protein